jgi:hypothetical protein
VIKKIFVGGLLAIVFGLLILGAVNRTLAKSSDEGPLALSKNLSEERMSGNGYNGNNQAYAQDNTMNDVIPNGKSQGYGNKVLSEERVGNEDHQEGADVNRYGGGNWGRSESEDHTTSEGANSMGIGQANVDLWLIDTGVVVSVSDDEWVIELSDATEIVFEGRMLSYLIEHGFSVSIGDTLSLTGFFDGDKFEVGQVQNTLTGELIHVRDENGRPLWAGGRRGGKGE